MRLKLFGSASIDGPAGPLTGRAVQRRRLALLALLAVARERGLTREKLVGYLWPDADPERARRLLSDSIYRINQAVGGEAIVAVGDELRLNPERLPSDAWEFGEAIVREDWARAVALHAAPFMDGFFLSGADELERWVDAERETLLRARARALEALAESAESEGDVAAAVRWWRMLATQDPYSSRTALRLMRALDASGDRAAALRHARVHAVLLEEELGLEPDAELARFVEELRTRSSRPRETARARSDAGLAESASAPAQDRGAGKPTQPEALAPGAQPGGPAAPPAGPPSAGRQPPPPQPAGRGGARPRRRRLVLASGGLALALLAMFGGRLLLRRRPRLVHLGRVQPVTNDPGLELGPALSPDGRFVAYSGPDGRLMVRQVGGPGAVPVVRAGDGTGHWPAWTPDGQSLVFDAPAGIEAVAALGGAPRVLAPGTDLGGGVAVAPDGRFFAYISHDSLYAAPLGGGRSRLVTTGYEIYSPTWSRDGRWIAFVSGNVQYMRAEGLANPAPSSIRVVPAEGGRALPVVTGPSVNVSPVWTSVGGLLFVSDRDGSRDVYEVALSRAGRPAGPPVRLTTGLQPHTIALSLNGSRLAYSRLIETSNVWSLPVTPGRTLSVSAAQPVTTGDQVIDNIDVSRDGRWLLYNSDVRGTVQLYRVRLDLPGQLPEQITTDTVPSYWSDLAPDEREVAFHRFHGERRQIFVMSIDGGAPVPVTDGLHDERSPQWSPDGRSLLLEADWATRPAIHIVTRGPDGRWSAPRTLWVVVDGDTLSPAGLSAWSPDGRMIACGCGPGGLVIAPVAGGPARRLRSPYSTVGWDFPAWSADGRTVYHVSQDASGRVVSVVAVPVSGAAPWVAVRFDDPTRPWHRYGLRVRNGRFYFTLGDRESDIWVAEVGSK